MGIYQGVRKVPAMSNPTPKRAFKSYRDRRRERGLTRFEVLGRDADRDLIRSLAKRLAAGGPEAARIRAAVGEDLNAEKPMKGGVLAALRRSPLVGADIDVDRSPVVARKVDL